MSDGRDPLKPARTLVGRPVPKLDAPTDKPAEDAPPAEPPKLPGIAPVVIPAGAETTMPMGSSSLREALNAALAAGPAAVAAQTAALRGAGQQAPEGTDQTTLDPSPPTRGASIAAALAGASPAEDPIAQIGAQLGAVSSPRPGSQAEPVPGSQPGVPVPPGSQPGIAARPATGIGSSLSTLPLGSPAIPAQPRAHTPSSSPLLDRTMLAGSPPSAAQLAASGPQQPRAGSQPGTAHLERTILAGSAPSAAEVAAAALVSGPQPSPLAGTPIAPALPPDSMFARAKPPTGPNPAVAAYAMAPNDATMMAPPSTAIEPPRERIATDPLRPVSTEALREVATDLYEVGPEIARGGMGRILKARDVRLRREVAIKELLGNNAMFKARFEREALITARLQHPAIVPIYEAGRWPTGELFYTMKLVSGRPLEDMITSAITVRQRLALLPNIIAVAEALAYAHSHNVVHRDLKPANILVGDFGETIVIDWGLAKDLATNEASEPAGPFRTPAIGAVGATVAGSVMGTPAYMPPEQGKGQQVDTRADVYATGAVLYHVLGHRAPYDGPDGMSILQAMLAGPPPPISSIVPDLPRELAAIVEKAMARDPGQRYPTARELVEDLRRFQNGQMVGVHRYTSRELFKRWAKKHKGALAVGGAAILVLGIVGVLAISRVVAANREAQQQRDEALSQQTAAVSARARAEESEGRAKRSEREVAIERDRARFARERRVEFDHFAHTQRVPKCAECHPVDPKTFTAKIGAPGHAECRGCHDPDSMQGLSIDPKCAFCHIDRVAMTKDHSSLRACDDGVLRAVQSAGGKGAPCFRHDRKEHRIDDKGQPLECTICHALLADKTKWGAKKYVTLHDLDTNTIIGQGPGLIDAMHKACTTGCHAHEAQTGLGTGVTDCKKCHPKRDAF
jgi:tRNA A-37 threonylcarbamoyl transferase component Bud32